MRNIFTHLLAEVQNIPLPDALKEAETTEGSRFIGEFFNMLFILALIVVALYVSTWLFKRMLSQRTMQMNTTSQIKVLEHRPLSQKSALYIIEVFGQTMVISESLNGIKFLSEIKKNKSNDE